MQRNEQTRTQANKKAHEEAKEKQEKVHSCVVITEYPKEEEITLLKQQIELLNLQKKGNEQQLSMDSLLNHSLIMMQERSGVMRDFWTQLFLWMTISRIGMTFSPAMKLWRR